MDDVDKEEQERQAAHIKQLVDEAVSNEKVGVLVMSANRETGRCETLLMNGTIEDGMLMSNSLLALFNNMAEHRDNPDMRLQ